MIIKVGINEISVVEQDLLNAGEYNIHECNFVFDEVYDGLVKKAVFSNKSHSYQVSIVNNSCIIPYEILQENGAITIGVYAYEVQDEELIMRYSPKPCTKYIDIGSYKEHYDNYEEVTPTDKEQIEQAIANLENVKVDKIEGKGLSTNDFTDENKRILNSITDEDINNWNNKSDFSGDYNDLTNKPNIPTKTSDLTNDNGYITKTVDNLTNYTLKTNTGSIIDLEINSSTYLLTFKLKNQDGTIISSDTIDLPLESVVVGGSYDSVNKKVVLTLQNGNTIEFSVADLVAGLQTEITSENKLSSDLVDDINQTNKFVTEQEKTTWNGKYTKANTGIPKTDLASDVQTSLGKADTAIQQHQDISGKEDKTNKTTTISSSSTDTQYPSALAVYNYVDGIVGNINTLLDTLNRTEV